MIKNIFIALLCFGFSTNLLAQENKNPTPPQPAKNTNGAIALDPTGKRFMKPRERTKFGGPVANTLSIAKHDTTMNISFLEIQLDPNEKNGLDVSLRGTRTTKLNGCDYCTIAGRLIVNGKAADGLESVAKDENTKTKQQRNSGAARVVTFKHESNQEFSVVTSPEAGFMLSTLPNGTYSIWVAGKKVITDFVLKTIAVKTPTPAINKPSMETKTEE